MPEITVNLPKLEKIINKKFFSLWDNQDRYMLLYGSRGSSKSNFAAKKKIKDCLTLPYFRDILIRDKYNSIKDSQYSTIKAIIHEWGLESLFTFTVNPLEIKCINGNIFYARGCDDVENIKSITDPTGAWYEEANNISKEDWITITTSIRTSKAPFLQEIMTFNPECDGEPENFWLYDTFTKNGEGRHNLSMELPSGEVLEVPYIVHHSTYKDNKWITPQFIAQLEQLKQLDPYFYDVYALGIWGTKKNERPFWSQFDEGKHLSTDAVYDPRKQLLISMDFNLQPFSVIFAHLWRDQTGVEHLHIFDEAEIQHGNIPAMAELIKERYLHSLLNCKITGDSMGKRGSIEQQDNASLYTQLVRLLPGVRPTQLVLPNNPTHENSKADCNYILSFFPDFKVNPKKCPNLVRDMKNVQVDAFGSIIKKNRNDINQRSDYSDANRYLISTFLHDWINKHSKGLHKRKS